MKNMKLEKGCLYQSVTVQGFTKIFTVAYCLHPPDQVVSETSDVEGRKSRVRISRPRLGGYLCAIGGMFLAGIWFMHNASMKQGYGPIPSWASIPFLIIGLTLFGLGIAVQVASSNSSDTDGESK